MIRRNFLKNAAVLGATWTFPSCVAKAKDEPQAQEFIHNSTELDTSILIKGLEEPFTLLHITDSHVSCENDETEEPYISYSRQMHEWNGPDSHRHFQTHELISPLQCFERLMEMAKEKKPDLMVFGGDIINYPSEKAAATVLQLINQTGIPWVYTAGNHDWYYPDIPGDMESLRKEWIEKRLKGFYQGRNPMYDSLIWKGINMVTLDNSTNQVNEEQVAFYEQQAAKPQPIVLFVHIPLYMPSMRMGREAENPSTVAFREAVMQTKQLAGIFTGHIHEHRVIAAHGKIQYITSQAADGRYKFVHFKGY